MAIIPTNQGNPQATDVAVESALPMVGSSIREDLQATLSKADAQSAKLFEDRNISLVDGGNITFPTLGTSVSFSQNLKLHINSQVAGGSPTIIDLGATTRTLSANLKMIYAVINRTLGTAVVTDDSSTLPAVTASNQEVVLIAKRVDSGDGTKMLYFRNGAALTAGSVGRLGSGGGANTFLSNLTPPTSIPVDLLPAGGGYTTIVPLNSTGFPYTVSDHNAFAQPYTPGSTVSVAKIGFNIVHQSGFDHAGSFTGLIYDSNGVGSKPGTLLATGSTVSASGVTGETSPNEVTFIFSSPVTLTGGHLYYLTLSQSGISTNAYSLGGLNPPSSGLYHDSPSWNGPDSQIGYSVYSLNPINLGSSLLPWSNGYISAIHNLSDPTLAQDAATKAYVDAAIGAGSSTITIKDDNFTITDDIDTTKRAKFETNGISTATTRTFTFPDANTTLVGTAVTQTLTNKTLSGNTATNLINGAGTLNLNSSGTITTPNATDTLVGKATTDILTNKTLSGNTAANLVNGSGTFNFNSSGALTAPNVTDTLAVRDTAQFLTNKQIAFSTADNSIATSSSADLTLPATGIVRLTNVSLTSIAGIAAGSSGQEVILTNATGGTVALFDNGGGGTTADATLFAHADFEANSIADTVTNSTHRVGQSWTATANGQIDSIRLSAHATTAAPAGTFKVDVYLANGSGLPTGSALGSSSNVNANNVLLNSFSHRITFPFSVPVTGIVSGTQYVLVLNTTSTTFTGGAVIRLNGRGGGTDLLYSGGTLVSGDNDTPPTGWTTTPGSDLWFEVISNTGDGIIAHNPSYAGGDLTTTGGSNWSGQAFTALTTSSVTKAFIALSGTATGTLTAKIRATSGGLPTGADLGISTALSIGLTTDHQILEFDFPAPVAVSTGIKYALLLDVSAASGNIGWAQSGGNGAGGSDYSSAGFGDYLQGSATGTGWSTIGSQPTAFGVYFIISSGATAVASSDQILTGTGSSASLLNNASATLVYDSTSSKWRVVDLPAATNKKDLFVLTATDISTNHYIDLSHVARTDSVCFQLHTGNLQTEGASYDYTISYTGGSGGNTRINFNSVLYTGGSALPVGSVVTIQYQY